ncbi:MAG: carbohydrate kinase family protein, partial [Candidatus Izemoplasmatales bacterium]
MKSLVIGVSSYDTLIYIDNLSDIKSDYSTWAKRVSYNIGGTGAGKALALKTLGVNVTLATDLGEDEFGVKILDFLQKQEIKLKILKADKSTTHTNIMHDNGKRLSIFTSTPNQVEFAPSLESLISSSDIIFLNINDYCREYIPLIKKYKKITIVDIHDYDLGNPYHQEFIDASDILFASGINIKNQKKFLQDNIKDKEVIIITNAENGSIAIDKNNKIYHQK